MKPVHSDRPQNAPPPVSLRLLRVAVPEELERRQRPLVSLRGPEQQLQLRARVQVGQERARLQGHPGWGRREEGDGIGGDWEGTIPPGGSRDRIETLDWCGVYSRGLESAGQVLGALACLVAGLTYVLQQLALLSANQLDCLQTLPWRGSI